MQLYGVCNASPDSLNADSIVTTVEQATRRAGEMREAGAERIDLGGQGSTDIATVVPWQDEWERLREVVPAIASLGMIVSIDTWRPEVARLALQHGATVLNAADGLLTDEMWQVGADLADEIVLPYLNGPDPRNLKHIVGDPVQVMVSWFEAQMTNAARFGVSDRVVLDPGTGFAPANWLWEQRYHFQKYVYSNLGQLRRFGRPLYIALPWRETAQHDELLDIVLAARVEFGRAHYPAKIRRRERELGLTMETTGE